MGLSTCLSLNNPSLSRVTNRSSDLGLCVTVRGHKFERIPMRRSTNILSNLWPCTIHSHAGETLQLPF
jgi:hypothetical protein